MTEFEAMQAEITTSAVFLSVLLVVTARSVYVLAYGIAETHDSRSKRQRRRQ